MEAVAPMFARMQVSSASQSAFFAARPSALRPAAPGAASPAFSPCPLRIEAAHKKGSGSTKNGRDSNAQRLGVKVYGDQPAKAGSIIVRQRGTKFHPGNNVGLGKDYTIYSLIDGLVKFEQFGPEKKKKISVYPVTEEKVENPNSRKVLRREMFRAQREKKRAQREVFDSTPLISIANLPAAEDAAEC